jgi:hypothetical protein
VESHFGELGSGGVLLLVGEHSGQVCCSVSFGKGRSDKLLV